MDPDRDLLDIIVAHSTEAVCLVGADGSIVFVNARLCGLSGYEPGELPGRPSADLFPDLALPSASAVAVAAGPSPCRTDLRHKDGAAIPVEVRCRPIRWQQSDHILVQCLDTAERNHSLFDMSPVPLWEEDLSGVAESVNKLQQRAVTDLRAHLLSHPDLLRECAARVRILDVNRAALALGRIPNRETALLGLGEVFDEADYPTFAEGIAQLAQGSSRAAIEGQVRRSDGSPVDVLLSFILFPTASEDWSRVILAMTDISELKRLQCNLQAAQRLARIGSWELDLRGNNLWWSDEVYRIFGIDSEKFGASYEAFLDTIHPDDRVRVNAAYTAHIEQDAPYNIRHRLLLRDADGSQQVRHVHERCQTERDSEGKPLRSLGTVQDVTSQVLREQERADQALNMEHTQRLESLGVLSGGIAHRFNNLLTAILGHASLAHEDVGRPDDLHKHLAVIEEAGSRAAKLCRQMLAYSGSANLDAREVALTPLIRNMIDLVEISGGKHATLTIDLAEDLPVLRADPGQMQQVVLNLVNNAREAIGEKSGRIGIATRRVAADDPLVADLENPGTGSTPAAFVCLEVSDDGCGMDAATADRVVEPFFSTKFTGRGLGMSSVQGIVRSHDGFLAVDSTPGEGTTIRVILPVPAM